MRVHLCTNATGYKDIDVILKQICDGQCNIKMLMISISQDCLNSNNVSCPVCQTFKSSTSHIDLSCTFSIVFHKGPENGDLWTERGDRFQAVFSKDVVRLRADGRLKAGEWVKALQDAVEAQRPARREGEDDGAEVVEGAPGLQGVLLRSIQTGQRQKTERGTASQTAVGHHQFPQSAHLFGCGEGAHGAELQMCR